MNQPNTASFRTLYPRACSFLLLGEAGCGKSEIAVNLALTLAQEQGKPVHFFDLDMTKPLFRSRDLTQRLTDAGITVHYEEQFMDAPTAAGGVTELLSRRDVYTVLDVGGDSNGARAVGGYAPFLNRPECTVFYVINPFRPWSGEIRHIDMILGQILGVSHVQLQQLHLLGNPNLGPLTKPEQVEQGAQKLQEMIGPYMPAECFTVTEDLVPLLEQELPGPVIPIRLYLTYEWELDE